MTKYILITVGIILLVAASGITYTIFIQDDNNSSSSVSSSPNDNEQTDAIPEGDSVVVEGILMCLPHISQDGMQTLECAYGLQDDSGTYYAVQDTTNDYSVIMGIPMNVRVQATGIVEPKVDNIYKSTKVIYVTKLEQLN